MTNAYARNRASHADKSTVLDAENMEKIVDNAVRDDDTQSFPFLYAYTNWGELRIQPYVNWLLMYQR